MLLQKGVRVDQEGNYHKNPSLALLSKLDAGKYELLEAIHDTTNGGNGSTGQLDKQRALVYIEILEAQLMELVNVARRPVGIPQDMAPAEQIIQLLERYPTIKAYGELFNRLR